MVRRCAASPAAGTVHTAADVDPLMTRPRPAPRPRLQRRRIPLALAGALLVAFAPAAAAVAQPPTPAVTATSTSVPGPTSSTTRPANGPASPAPSTGATSSTTSATSTTASTSTTTSTTAVSPLAASGPMPDAVAISSLADHPSVAPGTSVTLTLDVTDRGRRPLTNVTVRSAGCGPLSAPAKMGGNGDALLDPGETWRFTCSRVVTADVTQISTVRGAAGPDLTVASQASSTLHLTAPGVRVDLSADRPATRPGTVVTYTADVSTGDNTPLTVQSVVIPGCGPLPGPGRLGGDGDDLLEPGETWRYTCTRTLLATATTNARVTATDGQSNPLTATAQLQVPVINPAVSLFEAVPAAVVAGTPEVLVYVVSNPGDVALSGVRVTSSVCSPVQFVGPDPNLNGVLDPGESWTFRCGVTLPSSTTEVVGVTAQEVLTATAVTAGTSTTLVVTPNAPTGSAPVPGPSAPSPDPGPPAPTADPGSPPPSPDPGVLGANASPPYLGTSPYVDPSNVPGHQDPSYQGPGSSDPGSSDPGSSDPGSSDPGSSDPGSSDPRSSDPTYQDPASSDPASSDPTSSDSTSSDSTSSDPTYQDPASNDPGSYDSSYDPYAADSTYSDSLYNDLGNCSSYTDGSSYDPSSDPSGLGGPVSTVGPLDSTDPSGTSGLPDPPVADLLAGAASQVEGTSSDLGPTTTTTSTFSDPLSTDSLSTVPPSSDTFTDSSQTGGCIGPASLPTTGTDAGRLASGGLVLVASGAVLVGLGRRRRPATARGTQQ